MSTIFDPFDDVESLSHIPEGVVEDYEEGTCFCCKEPLEDLRDEGYAVVGRFAACQPCLRLAHQELVPIIEKMMLEDAQ